MNKPTTIFFPDISGFTEFVDQTEIEHGQHIIASLLEEIIESNYLDFVVSEIEGDAILFYKNTDDNDIEELLKLSQETHKKFHEKLKKLHASTHCACGACSSISSLSLKFIILIGNASSIKIHNFEKLYGLDVIIAHRLLKNEISDQEYVLFINNSHLQINEVKPISGISGPVDYMQNISKIGKIQAFYFTFTNSNKN